MLCENSRSRNRFAGFVALRAKIYCTPDLCSMKMVNRASFFVTFNTSNWQYRCCLFSIDCTVQRAFMINILPLLFHDFLSLGSQRNRDLFEFSFCTRCRTATVWLYSIRNLMVINHKLRFFLSRKRSKAVDLRDCFLVPTTLMLLS